MDLQLSMDKTWLLQVHLYPYFLAWAFAPKLYEHIQSFNSQPLFLCQWLARSSDLDNSKPEIKIQTEGHTHTPNKWLKWAWKSQRQLGEPHHIPYPSLWQRKPMPDWPETWYCLEIKVISTEDDKVIPPPTHTWQTPIVEDMVREGKVGLTEARVTGTGWAVLFYGQTIIRRRTKFRVR